MQASNLFLLLVVVAGVLVNGFGDRLAAAIAGAFAKHTAKYTAKYTPKYKRSNGPSVPVVDERVSCPVVPLARTAKNGAEERDSVGHRPAA